jgi:hypothetical protein
VLIRPTDRDSGTLGLWDSGSKPCRATKPQLERVTGTRTTATTVGDMPMRCARGRATCAMCRLPLRAPRLFRGGTGDEGWGGSVGSLLCCLEGQNTYSKHVSTPPAAPDPPHSFSIMKSGSLAACAGASLTSQNEATQCGMLATGVEDVLSDSPDGGCEPW